MSIFRRNASLPTTSYGYAPPPEATANGWLCPSEECGAGGDAAPRRWPATCARCGGPVDPQFDEPWSHESRGPWIRHKLATERHPAGRTVWQSNLIAWNYKDALFRGEAELANQRLGEAHDYIEDESHRAPGSFFAGDVMFGIVRDSLDFGQADTAALELKFWRAQMPADNVEHDNMQRNNCLQLLRSQIRFLEEPGTATHPAAPEIRAHAVEVAGITRRVLPAGIGQQLERLL
jgi:hypothetical protein